MEQLVLLTSLFFSSTFFVGVGKPISYKHKMREDIVSHFTSYY